MHKGISVLNYIQVFKEKFQKLECGSKRTVIKFIARLFICAPVFSLDTKWRLNSLRTSQFLTGAILFCIVHVSKSNLGETFLLPNHCVVKILHVVKAVTDSCDTY